jgi:ureidoglycolate hydrolase
MADLATSAVHFLPVNDLTPDRFAPFGEVVKPAPSAGQGIPSKHPDNPKLVLSSEHPRLWVMQLQHRGLTFSKMARHRRVTQCLGSLTGEEWFISVAPPGDLSDEARPRTEEITAFRIPPGHLIKLHCATWHAGPHVAGAGGLFFNLENEDTNTGDNHIVELDQQCQYKL